VALSGGVNAAAPNAGAAPGVCARLKAGPWRRRCLLTLALVWVLILTGGALSAMAIAAHLIPLVATVKDVVDKVNAVYDPLVGAIAQVDDMYTGASKGAGWALQVLKAACDAPNLVPSALRALLCGS
jgi:hypothetical protein